MIKELHDLILDTVKETVPCVESHGYYVTQEGEFNTPAVYLELSALHPERQCDGTIRYTAHFQLDCLVASENDDPHIEAQHLACEIGYRISNAQFSKASATMPKITAIRPNEFNADYEGVKTWSVEFTTTFTWGESSFNFIKPSKAFVGIAPKTGPEHVNDYREYDLGKSTGKPA